MVRIFNFNGSILIFVTFILLAYTLGAEENVPTNVKPYMKTDIDNHPENYTVWFKMIFERVNNELLKLNST